MCQNNFYLGKESIAGALMFSGTLQGTAALTSMVAGISLCSYYRQVTGPEFLPQLDTLSVHITIKQIGTRILCSMLSLVLVSS